MDEINKLLEIVDLLLGPDGCPWDREQTMESVRSYVLEETCELIEAIDLQDNAHIKEELGDLFFNAIFLSRLAEKEKRFSFRDVVESVTDKLIKRHPHVFQDVKLDSMEALANQWELLKSQEKGKSQRTSALDGISKSLPVLLRAKKMIKAMKKKKYTHLPEPSMEFLFDNEEDLGRLLYQIAFLAEKKDIDPENALRKVLANEERNFRAFERGGEISP